MESKNDQTWIVYLSTFPPRECGIATFTQDLVNAVNQTFYPRIKSKVVAINASKEEIETYPSKVIRTIDQTDQESYIKAAEYLNRLPQVKLVNIQHEYGIHGGELGSHLIGFLKALKKPAVLTMHTVHPEPSELMFNITKELLTLVSKVIVLTNRGKEILTSLYPVDPSLIEVVPHGIHPVQFSLPNENKIKVGFKKKQLILSTFGLLSRNKGIEYVIESLPEVVKTNPNLIYLVIGETHPVIRRQEGEAYRHELLALVKKLGLSDHVRFYDRYLSLKEILQFLQATDIYVSTSLDPNQAVSGTFSYALGTGRCIVATAFSQAKEVVTPQIGRLVDFKNPDSYRAAFLDLLKDENTLRNSHLIAYVTSRHMLWSNVAISYLNIFSSLQPSITSEEKNLPEINLSHLRRMTDSFGMFQFARLSEPDPSYGYTIDDNARAMIAMVELYDAVKYKPALTLVRTYLNFIESCQTPSGRFINYIDYEQKPIDKLNQNENLNDANGRAIWALGTLLSSRSIPKVLKNQAKIILNRWIDAGSLEQIDTPRSMAFIAKGLCRAKFTNHHNCSSYMSCYADLLTSLYHQNSSSSWQWFEPSLTYANGTLPEAMFIAYKNLKDPKLLEIATKTTDFLIKNSFQGPIYVPVGQNGWFKNGGAKSLFDQQPEDAVAMIHLLRTAYQITKKKRYHQLMYKTFYWFLGNNLLGKLVYDKHTGGCFDALTPDNVNLNQGAESTVSYLLARIAVGLK